MRKNIPNRFSATATVGVPNCSVTSWKYFYVLVTICSTIIIFSSNIVRYKPLTLLSNNREIQFYDDSNRSNIIIIINNNNNKNNDVVPNTSVAFNSFIIDQTLPPRGEEVFQNQERIAPSFDLDFECLPLFGVRKSDNVTTTSFEDSEKHRYPTNISWKEMGGNELYIQNEIGKNRNYLTDRKTDTVIITLIVYLDGQSGNFLSRIGNAYGLKRSIERKYNNMDNSNNNSNTTLVVKLAGQHTATTKKSNKVRNFIQRCFPKIESQFRFTGGLTDETESFLISKKLQEDWLQDINERLHQEMEDKISANYHPEASELESPSNEESIPTSISVANNTLYMTLCPPNHHTGQCWHNGYCLLQSMLEQQRNEPWNTKIQQAHLATPTTTSVPYIYTSEIRFLDAVDDYYDEIRTLFQFNEDSCCRKSSRRQKQKKNMIVPYDDEVVLHIRNFTQRAFIEGGFHEMDPNQVADELFQQYYSKNKERTDFTNNPNDTGEIDYASIHNDEYVDNATTTTLLRNRHLMSQNQKRNPKKQVEEHTQRIALVSKDPVDEYEHALRQRGFINVRQIHGKSSMNDFCFLLQTKYHLIGMKTSTFATWAGILSNATRVRLYVIDSHATRQRASTHHIWYKNSWYNPILQQRIHFELYQDPNPAETLSIMQNYKESSTMNDELYE